MEILKRVVNFFYALSMILLVIFLLAIEKFGYIGVYGMVVSFIFFAINFKLFNEGTLWNK
jgi:ABC-type dipeptide/oligopeptide/nickel transport system permease subunit